MTGVTFRVLTVIVVFSGSIVTSTTSLKPKFEQIFNKTVLDSLSDSVEQLSVDDRTSNDTKKCLEDIEFVFDGINRSEIWALRMFDAWAKELPSGLLYGNTMDLGNFDECMSVSETIGDRRRKRVINGQHCTIIFDVHDPRSGGNGTELKYAVGGKRNR